MKKTLMIIGLTLSLVKFTVAAPSTPWPELSTPPKSSLEWVARDVTINGMPTRIQRVRSELSVGELTGFFRTLWSGNPNGKPQDQKLGEWNILSTMQGPVNIVIQAKKVGAQGSEGYISMANFVEFKKDYFPPSWPTSLEVKVLQFMESVDGAKRSYHLTAINDRDLSATTNHIKNEFSRKGWKIQREEKFPLKDGGSSWRIMMATADSDKTLDITTSQLGRREPTNITLNVVQPTEGRR